MYLLCNEIINVLLQAIAKGYPHVINFALMSKNFNRFRGIPWDFKGKLNGYRFVRVPGLPLRRF